MALPVGSLFGGGLGMPDLRAQLKQQQDAETEAANSDWLSSASGMAQANQAKTPTGRLYSIYDPGASMNSVPTTPEDQLNANAFGVNGANQYAKLWNYSRDRANAAGGKAQVRDERENFGTASPLAGLRRAGARGY